MCPRGKTAASNARQNPTGSKGWSPEPQTKTRGALPPFPFVKTCLACHANKVFEMNRVKSMWRGRGGMSLSQEHAGRCRRG